MKIVKACYTVNIVCSVAYILAVLGMTGMAVGNGTMFGGNIYLMWLRFVFCLVVGIGILVKCIKDKKLYWKAKNKNNEFYLFLVLQVIGWLMFTLNILVLGNEILVSGKMGSIAGIIAVMAVLNVESNSLKKNVGD